MKSNLIIYWARRDLRLEDNSALFHAIAKAKETGAMFAPVFILEDYMLEASPDSQFGYPQRYFLSQAIPKFTQQFNHFHLIRGKGARSIIELVQKYNLEVFVNQDIYPDFDTQTAKIKEAGIVVNIFKDRLSVNPETRSQNGSLYTIFTPFKKSVWKEFLEMTTLPKPNLENINYATLPFLTSWQYVEPETRIIESLFSTKREIKILDIIYDLDQYLPLPNLSNWYTSESEALERFNAYLMSGKLDNYSLNRNSLELDIIDNGQTSRMSLALAWGFISARKIKAEITKYLNLSLEELTVDNKTNLGAITYISELIWREFYVYLLYHQPDLLDLEFQTQYRQTINWTQGKQAQDRFISWITGKTGYTVVDASMQQLAQTGWMHNRSRMIVASVLSKNLGIDWRWGQEYFRASLIDLDEPSNNGGWQWGASVGADPKPIRIFNPYLQAENYDTKGLYQDQWLDEHYYNTVTKPIIEHPQARQEAIIRYKQAKEIYLENKNSGKLVEKS
jgi:deoxyribodipyrimidine photo-lyase